ncbi:MAG: decarboxylating 6-phosphogluconate dehydrogenase [Actinomycetota bacterium]|nr:decarboxylating 6-phosphogluconate dehydrogenase [Actinomycetota bacterium]
MKLGMVGLGKMGANMTRRLVERDHEVIAFDVDEAAVKAVTEIGARGAGSLAALVEALDSPRVVWLMVPAGAITQQTISELTELLQGGDTVVDGGNSRYGDSIRRAEDLAQRGIRWADAGTSGGIWGLTEGFCLMVGSDAGTFKDLEPIFSSLAPPDGYARVGPPGAGHFVKMVHNGIEYALMQSYGEGFELLRSSDMELDVDQIAELWRHGSVVRSWLLDLAAKALASDPQLTDVAGYVEDSGEGRWTVETALENAVPAPVITLSLMRRFSSRQPDSFSNKLIAALRREFGGHATRGEE